MEDLRDIVDRMSYVGMIRDWNDSHFNEYVITGVQSGFSNNPNKRIGRIVQVRLKAGAFGSDLVLLRHANGDLTSHENQSFTPLKGEDRKRVHQAFLDANVCTDDPINREYSICGKLCFKGFIVPDEETRRARRNEKIECIVK